MLTGSHWTYARSRTTERIVSAPGLEGSFPASRCFATARRRTDSRDTARGSGFIVEGPRDRSGGWAEGPPGGYPFRGPDARLPTSRGDVGGETRRRATGSGGLRLLLGRRAAESWEKKARGPEGPIGGLPRNVPLGGERVGSGAGPRNRRGEPWVGGAYRMV